MCLYIVKYGLIALLHEKKKIMDRFDLVNLWKAKIQKSYCYTWNNKMHSIFFLNFWLVSGNLKEQDISIIILPCPLTSVITSSIISIHLLPSNSQANYWELNCLLEHDS